MEHALTEKEIKVLKKNASLDAKDEALSRAIQSNGINVCAVDSKLVNTYNDCFNVDCNFGVISNQKKSGRCWMFAGFNTLKNILAKNLNVENIEISQAYLQFYDKLEKANFYLNRVEERLGEPFDSRDNIFLLDSAIQDGGHYAMFMSLVKKYGLIPSAINPDNCVNNDTGEINKVLTNILAKAMCEMRKAYQDSKDYSSVKEKAMKDVYRVLSMAFGKPVETFSFDYHEKDEKKTYHRIENITPVEFYNTYVKEDLDQYVPLCNTPIENMAMYQKYRCQLVGNVIGGDDVIFFNVPSEAMKKAVITSLKDNSLVWFAADVSTQTLRKGGYFIDGVLKFDDLFGIDTKMSKAERMTYRTSFCNHAMTFVGVNVLDNGTADKWKVENSWGDENGIKGHYVMADNWFDEYVDQVLVKRCYIDEETLKKYDASDVKELAAYNTIWAEMK